MSCARLGTEACHSIRPRTQHHPEQAWRGLRGIPRENKPAITSDPAATNGRSAGLLPASVRFGFFISRNPYRRSSDSAARSRTLKQPMSHSMANDNSSTLTAAAYRDYYVARHRQGALCWVFTSPQPTPRQRSEAAIGICTVILRDMNRHNSSTASAPNPLSPRKYAIRYPCIWPDWQSFCSSALCGAALHQQLQLLRELPPRRVGPAGLRAGL